MRASQGGDATADGNLPLETDRFVGRSAELTELARALDASRLVTVTGPGGVGKSRLAARAATRSAPRTASGGWSWRRCATRNSWTSRSWRRWG